jgi:hypothetical protein
VADPAQYIGLGEQRHPLEWHGHARRHHGPFEVRPIEKPERQAVPTNQTRDLLAQQEGRGRVEALALPEDLAGVQLTLACVAGRADAAIRFDQRTLRLGNVVEQSGDKECRARGRRQRLPGWVPNKGLGDHAGVDEHVALGMVVWILRHAIKRLKPGTARDQRWPIQCPVGAARTVRISPG